MNKDRIDYYTSKITSGTMTSIICTMYEIFFEYIDDACKEENIVNPEEIRKAARVLEHLKDSLNFEYDVSSNLFALYDFSERELSKAMYTNKQDHVENARKVMKELYEAFKEVDSQNNDGEKALKNTQTVTAGLTYGKNDVTSIIDNPESNRGFLV